jgi:hypothetical protein
MYQFFLIATASLLFIACKKENTVITPPASPAHPQMVYTDLQNAEVKFLQSKRVDVDGDGSTDFSFGVLLVGDPILQRDRLQFYVNSGVKRNLLNDDQDQSPVLNKFDSIGKTHPGYTWWEISAIVLAEKVIDNSGTSWQGLWKNADHKYLPIQVDKNGKLFHGWIELSFSTSDEKLILHQAALSKEQERSIQAGV